MQAKAQDLRDQHRHRLAEHRCLGLDAAHAPAEDAEAVDHRGVRIGPDQRVGIGLAVVVHEHDAREVLEVDLVDDPRVGRDDREALEGVLAPAQELIALLVAFELPLGVDAEGVAGAVRVDLHRVVDDQLGGHQRVDLRGVAVEIGHRVAHRGEVDDGRHAGEVLQQHARGREGDLGVGLGAVVPARERLDVGLLHRAVALGPQQVLEQDLQRERQPRDVVGRLQRVEAVDRQLAVADLQGVARVERVGVLGHVRSFRRRRGG